VLEKTTRIVVENLARSMNRRAFLKRFGETAFAGVAALATGHALTSPTSARGQPATPPLCAPPGPYCNLNGVNEPNGCHGASCFQHRDGAQVLQCRFAYDWYAPGCWTTPSGGGYWVCCDCMCGSGSVYCGCAQWSGTPNPRPDGPNAQKGA
jgi:hypothetical protein